MKCLLDLLKITASHYVYIDVALDISYNHFAAVEPLWPLFRRLARKRKWLPEGVLLLK